MAPFPNPLGNFDPAPVAYCRSLNTSAAFAGRFLKLVTPTADAEVRAMAQRILLVGGTDSDRGRAEQALAGSGYETDWVPNGKDGFEQLMALPYALVVTDCSLEKLDCPAMMAKVRGLGVKTPFLLWSSTADPERMEAALKATGGSHVDKGGSMEDLVKQVKAVLNGAAPQPAQAAAEPQAKEESAATGGILLIDERESDVQSLRSLLPPSMYFESFPTAKEGLAHAHNHKFDLVLFSADNSITNLIGIVAQMHLLLPDGFVVGVATVARGGDPPTAVKALGGLDFDEVMLKPFKSGNVNRLVEHYCSSWDDLVTVSEDVVRASGRCSRKEQHKEFVATLKSRLENGVRGLIDACFDRAVVDMSRVESLSPMDFAETLRRLKTTATPFGLNLRFVAASAMTAALRKFESSFGWERLDLFPSLEAAHADKA